MTDLNTTELGDGAPVVLVHGSFSSAQGSFGAQRPLQDAYKLMLIDRRGYGESPDGEEIGWPADARDIEALLEELGGAHLVAHSYGAVGALVAAGNRPDLVRSLVVIEPPVFGLSDAPVAQAQAERTRALAADAPAQSTEEYVRSWAPTVGMSSFEVSVWIADFAEPEWRGAEASRREVTAVDAEIPFEKLREADFPKVVVHGGWPEASGARADAGAAFVEAAKAVAERMNARLAPFPECGHSAHAEAAGEFNALLRETWS